MIKFNEIKFDFQDGISVWDFISNTILDNRFTDINSTPDNYKLYLLNGKISKIEKLEEIMLRDDDEILILIIAGGG